jgi:hypothetical protein
VKQLSDHRRLVRPAACQVRCGLSRRLIFACGMAILLAACAGEEVVPPCPQLQLLKDTDRLVKFVGTGRDLTDVEYEAALRAPFMSCEYDDNVIESVLTVNLVALRGPADDDRIAQISYFVAITNENNRNVVKEEFTVEIPFEGNRTQVIATEEVEPRIPLQAQETAADYRVFVGLRLTPDELRYNQENR